MNAYMVNVKPRDFMLPSGEGANKTWQHSFSSVHQEDERNGHIKKQIKLRQRQRKEEQLSCPTVSFFHSNCLARAPNLIITIGISYAKSVECLVSYYACFGLTHKSSDCLRGGCR